MKLRKILLSYFIILLLTSCATSINVQVMRPAKFDLKGAQTISVLPFKPSGYYVSTEINRGVEFFVNIFFDVFDSVGPEEKKCIDKLQYEIEKGLMNSRYIDVIHSDLVSSAIKNGTSNPADVYLVGEVLDFDYYDKKFEEKIKIKDSDKDGHKPEYRIEISYSRIAKIKFRYRLVDSFSGKIIGYNEYEIINQSAKIDRKGNLPSAYYILEYDLLAAAKSILKELQPYYETKTIRLMEDKTKNPDFKEADSLAKNKNIAESYNAFLKIYEKTDMMAAGYNAAKLQEAMGNLSAAKKLMEEVYSKYPDEDVLKGLNDIKAEIKKAEILKTQTEFNDTLNVDF